MAWIELHDNLPDHPKTLAVARALHMDKDLVVGKLCRLWIWCLANREDGLLEMEDGETLCEVMRFNGEPEALMQALCTPPKGGETGFIERAPGGYRLHGWEERTGLLMETRAKKRAQTLERTRRYRERRKEQPPQDSRGCDAVVTRYGDAGCDAVVTQCDAPTEPNPTEPDPTEPNPLGGIPPREVRGGGREQEGPPAGEVWEKTDAGRRGDRADEQERRRLAQSGAGGHERGKGRQAQPTKARGQDRGVTRAADTMRMNGGGAREADGQWEQGVRGPDRRGCVQVGTGTDKPGRLEQGGAGAYEAAREADGQWEQGGRGPNQRGCVQAGTEKSGRPEQGGAGAIPHGGAKVPDGTAFAAEAGAVFNLPARGGEAYVLDAAQIGQLQAAYPELDLAGELRAMDSWLRANPQRARGERQMPRFVDGWLRNAQQRGRGTGAGEGDAVARFLALAQQMEREA